MQPPVVDPQDIAAKLFISRGFGTGGFYLNDRQSSSLLEIAMAAE
jgi:hypothetical protein